jgi:hypothetical protein
LPRRCAHAFMHGRVFENGVIGANCKQHSTMTILTIR